MNTRGKHVGAYTYYHIDFLPELDGELISAINGAAASANVSLGTDFNVIKLSHIARQISLLDYPGFFDDAFPTLNRSWTVDPHTSLTRYRTYEDSFNPPILHRKELLLPANHPRRTEYHSLTTSAEQIGLFDDPVRIGFAQSWKALLNSKGYRISGHTLVPIGNDEALTDQELQYDFSGIYRHLTALKRYSLSAPIQTLARFCFLDGSKAVFDYGCGRGDDIRGLRENGIAAEGWDPYYAPDEKKRPADIVNLGFVINVIENLEERSTALLEAYRLAKELLVVSAMLANQDGIKGTPYGDGIITGRNTFQKYHTQSELHTYITETLHTDPLPVGPGIFYIFKNKNAEQDFVYGRTANRRNALRLAYKSRVRPPSKSSRKKDTYNAHSDILEALWATWLSLGRDPHLSEVQDIDSITSNIGSLSTALRLIKSQKNNASELLLDARNSRIDDLKVYFSKQSFDKRESYSQLDHRIQSDIRAFFGNYRNALEAGKELLFEAGNTEHVQKACQSAAAKGVGWNDEDESLQLHSSLVNLLPAILRTYISCGTILYGDITSSDLIKIHVRSGKLTLMRFDDFVNNPLPRMIQRIKINLRHQDLKVFDYGESHMPPYLYRKSRFINEEFPYYAEQIAFEDALDSLDLFDFSGYGPSAAELDTLLKHHRYTINGFRLDRSQITPNLDEPCGKFLTYRTLIECGDTQSILNIANLPRQPDSYSALLDLTINALDPIIDYFGMIKLTYGFCSQDLSRHIKKNIAPKLDQHAAHEINRLGMPICNRLGAAVDFLVEDEDMIEVGKWIAKNIGFDRMYIYGPDCPIHISYNKNPVRQVTLMVSTCSNPRLLPKTIDLDHFQQYNWDMKSRLT